MNNLDFLILLLQIIILLLVLSVCNFLVKLAESINYIKKEIADYYYLLKEQSPNKNTNNPDSGLVDL